MNKDLVAIFEYMEREKGIKREVVVDAIKDAILAAARKSVDDVGNLTVEVNPRTGKIEVFSERQIVDEVILPAEQISVELARTLDPDCEVGQFIDVEIDAERFGRIAAQAARQLLSQKLRVAEKDVIYKEYRDREGELISGTVKRIARGPTVIVDLGKVEAIMPGREYPRTERYNVGDKVLAVLLAVQDTENGGAEVVLSRSSPKFVQELFKNEVPEIADGAVEVVTVVRDAGFRCKIVVSSQDPRVDPVGACVGMRGARVKNIVRELNNEKVDIVIWSDDRMELLQNALRPSQIQKYYIDEEAGVISIIVKDEDLSLVIGKGGKNLRLISQLVGMQLDVKSLSEYNRSLTQEQEADTEENPMLLDSPIDLPDISNLIIQNLQAAELDTPRKILIGGKARLEQVPGISSEMADQIIERISKKRA